MLPPSGLSGQWAGVGEEEEAAELKHAKRPAHLELGPLPARHSRGRAVRPLSLRAEAVWAQSGAGGRGGEDRGVCAGAPWAEAGIVDWHGGRAQERATLRNWPWYLLLWVFARDDFQDWPKEVLLVILLESQVGGVFRGCPVPKKEEDKKRGPLPSAVGTLSPNAIDFMTKEQRVPRFLRLASWQGRGHRVKPQGGAGSDALRSGQVGECSPRPFLSGPGSPFLWERLLGQEWEGQGWEGSRESGPMGRAEAQTPRQQR